MKVDNHSSPIFFVNGFHCTMCVCHWQQSKISASANRKVLAKHADGGHGNFKYGFPVSQVDLVWPTGSIRKSVEIVPNRKNTGIVAKTLFGKDLQSP